MRRGNDFGSICEIELARLNEIIRLIPRISIKKRKCLNPLRR